jgi:hypothetical protein
MLRVAVRAALTAILIPVASTFALAQTPRARAAGDPARHYTIFSSAALASVVTPLLDATEPSRSR